MDIEKLRHVLEHVLPRIAPAEFDMRKYVSQNDGSCGTVCCIAGWFPKHWPEAVVAAHAFLSVANKISFLPFVSLRY